MQRGNSVLLRSVFSAAIVCAVLRAATLSGADRAGSLPSGNVRETGPILVRSISTIKAPACLATINTIGEAATVAAEAQGEAKLQSCANVTPPTHRRSEPARKLFGVIALASLSPREAPVGFDAHTTILIGGRPI